VATSEMFKHVKKLDKFRMVWNEKMESYCVEGETTKREFSHLADTARALGCRVTRRKR
jgi:hypothetical protein